MDAHNKEIKDRALHSDPREELESPFLSEELFARESPAEGADLYTNLASESPFLYAAWEAFEEEILGKDDRMLVTNTITTPNRWICAIDILIENPRWGRATDEPRFISKSRATGILIGPRYVLTVRHILDKQTIEVDGEKKTVDVRGFTVSPARNGSNTNNPFEKVYSKAIRVSQPYWIRRKVRQGYRDIKVPLKQHDDYALIILAKDLASHTHFDMKGVLGYWGQIPAVAVIRRSDPNTLIGKKVVVIGYPGDTCGKDRLLGTTSEKENKIMNCRNRRGDEWASTQWKSVGTLEVERDSTTVFHTADTYEGQSGAPICLTADGKLYLVGIHTSRDRPDRNRGVRITRRTLRELCAWMNADAGYTIAAIRDDTLVVQTKSTTGASVREFYEDFAEEEDIDEHQMEDFPDETEFADAAEEERDEGFDDFDTGSNAIEHDHLEFDEWTPPEESLSPDTEIQEAFDPEEFEFEQDSDSEVEWEPEEEVEELAGFEHELLQDSETSEINDFLPEKETPGGVTRKLKYLSLLSHFVVDGGKEVVLTPDVMDPGIYDGPEKYQVAPKLQECLMGVMKKRAFNHIKVTLVDLSKDLSKPEFAGYNHKSQVFAASVPKIAPMLAAFQLRQDLRTALKQKGSKTLGDLFSQIRDDWVAAQADPGGKATPLTFGVSLKGKLVLVRGQKIPIGEPKAPKLEHVFAEVPVGKPVTIEFRSTGETKEQLKDIIEDFNKKKTGARAKMDAMGFLEHLRIMIGGIVPASNYATSLIVRNVGFLYIASTLLQSGLYDSNRKGGLWLGADYWGRVWRGPLGGGAAQSATAGSLAAFMILLGQKRLVSPQASAEMSALMKKEPNPTHSGIVSWFKEGLKELSSGGVLNLVLSKLGAHSGLDDCTLIEREVDVGGSKKMLRYVAVGLRARNSKELKSLILELDKCILANNGLTAAQGGHS